MTDSESCKTEGLERTTSVKQEDERTAEAAKHNSAPEQATWKDLTIRQKISRVLSILKILAKILILIYFFMCGIDTLTASFKLIGGKNINGLTRRGTLNNPLVGLMVGVLVTIMVQSSSTSTAIIVSLVSSGVISIQQAIPVIMGSNIGTSVTNTFVSFTQVGDRQTFRRAFAGATVHDMFNWLSVSSLLAVELITRSIPGSRGLLEVTTEAVVNATYSGNFTSSDHPGGLKTIIEPVISKIIQLDLKILECWARNESQAVDTIIDRFCDTPEHIARINDPEHEVCPTHNPNGSIPCCFLFSGSSMSDLEVGIILLICSLSVLIACLITLVKVLNRVLQGPVQEMVKKYINSDISCCPYMTGYIALIVGAILTIIMQSSSIFTSLLTPLIGMGVVSIERCYPLTLGSNIGTTTTAILAAFTANSKHAIQIALVHLFFNIFGILLFYPIPFMRFPIPMAKFLGKITSHYRWFAIAYIVLMFVVMPMFLLLLSEAGAIVFWSVIGTIVFIGIIIVFVSFLQRKHSNVLPKFLQNWNFVPLPLRSLAPYDRCLVTICSCGTCSGDKQSHLSSTSELKNVITSSSIRTISSLDSGFDNVKEQSEH